MLYSVTQIFREIGRVISHASVEKAPGAENVPTPWTRTSSIYYHGPCLVEKGLLRKYEKNRHENGAGQNKTGKSGDDLVLKVPLGTQVFEEDNKTLLFDFIKEGEKFIAANGGQSATAPELDI